jgi:hypothetical protein
MMHGKGSQVRGSLSRSGEHIVKDAALSARTGSNQTAKGQCVCPLTVPMAAEGIDGFLLMLLASVQLQLQYPTTCWPGSNLAVCVPQLRSCMPVAGAC